MKEIFPAERRVTEPKSPALPEDNKDQKLFDTMSATVQRALLKAKKQFGEVRGDAYRARIVNAIESALTDRQLTGARRGKFRSLLAAELGSHGGKKAAAKRAAEADFEEALDAHHIEQALEAQYKLEAEREQEDALRRPGESHD